MRELASAIPDPEGILSLEPEELGAKLIFFIRRRLKNDRTASSGMIHPRNMENELRGETQYQTRWDEISLVLAEAWAWLEAQGLIVPAEGTNGSSGWRRLSRRAMKFESEVDIRPYAFVRRLPKDALHPRIAEKVWAAFMRGEFDVAVLQAMKVVEVAIREAAGYSNADYGTDMIARAFNERSGPLRDKFAQPAEQIALRNLFVGAYGLYRNPQAHHDVDVSDPSDAVEIIMLANQLLRIVDRRRAGKL